MSKNIAEANWKSLILESLPNQLFGIILDLKYNKEMKKRKSILFVQMSDKLKDKQFLNHNVQDLHPFWGSHPSNDKSDIEGSEWPIYLGLGLESDPSDIGDKSWHA